MECKVPHVHGLLWVALRLRFKPKRQLRRLKGECAKLFWADDLISHGPTSSGKLAPSSQTEIARQSASTVVRNEKFMLHMVLRG
jgi:hypothetical protein